LTPSKLQSVFEWFSNEENMKIFKNLSDWSESDFSDKKFPSEKYDEESNGSVFSKEISNHSKS